MESDENVKDGKLLSDSFDYNLKSFQPDLLFEQMCKDYKRAEKLMGKTMVRELSGYDDSFVEKNVNIPEFQKELQQRITQKIEDLKEKELLDKEGKVTDKGIHLSSIIRYTQELNRITNKGKGREESKQPSPYGERDESIPYKGGRYQDVHLRDSVRKAARRGHDKLHPEDLVTSKRIEHSKLTVIYALDASGSMRGSKLRMAKRAGVALAHQAIQDKNDVGLIVFTSKIEKAIAPCTDFIRILNALTVVRAGMETDIALTIEEAITQFAHEKGTKHLVLLTDALPTKSDGKKKPRQRVLEAVSAARELKITISLIGINLDEEGERLARKMIQVGDGKLYLARNAHNVDAIILEDYESARAHHR